VAQFHWNIYKEDMIKFKNDRKKFKKESKQSFSLKVKKLIERTKKVSSEENNLETVLN
jgi:hypothetical protein